MEKSNQIEVVVANPFKGTSKNASEFFGGIDPAFIGNADTIAANPEQKNRFKENLALVTQYRSALITKEKSTEINTVLKLGGKVYSDFYGHGKIIMKQKRKLCFKVKFDDGRYNEFTREGNYLLTIQSEKAVEMNNRRKIRKV